MENTVSSSSQSPAQMPQKPRHYFTTKVLSLLCALCFLVGMGAGFGLHYLFSLTSKEGVAFNMLENNYDPTDYERFLADYPTSSHAPEVKQRLDALKELLDAWHRIESSSRVADFVRLKQQYKDPKFDFYCDTKIDSLDYVTAVATGKPEALQHYITAHSEGRFIVEAYEALEAAQNKERQKAIDAAVQQVVRDSSFTDDEIITIEEETI